MLTVMILLGSAILEVGGDALVRTGLRGNWVWILAGAAALSAYGIVVNHGTLDFGRLMGAYIAVFFVVSQVISIAMYRDIPGIRTLAGGALIVAGGLMML